MYDRVANHVFRLRYPSSVLQASSLSILLHHATLSCAYTVPRGSNHDALLESERRGARGIDIHAPPVPRAKSDQRQVGPRTPREGCGLLGHLWAACRAELSKLPCSRPRLQHVQHRDPFCLVARCTLLPRTAQARCGRISFGRPKNEIFLNGFSANLL